MRFPKDIMSNLLLVWCIRLVYVRYYSYMLIITTVDEWIRHGYQTVENHAFLGHHIACLCFSLWYHIVFVVVFKLLLVS